MGAEAVRSEDNVARRDERINRRDRTDRANVVTANRKLVAEEETLEDRYAVDERQRVGVPHLFGGGKTSHRSRDDAETEDLRPLRLLAAHREELRVRQRRLIGANVATQSGYRKRDRNSRPLVGSMLALRVSYEKVIVPRLVRMFGCL